VPPAGSTAGGDIVCVPVVAITTPSAAGRRHPDHLVGTQQEGYKFIPPLVVVFNLCDRRFATRSGYETWHLMKK
jgi:hypothetical protein